MTDKKFPSPGEIQKEFEEFFKQRFQSGASNSPTMNIFSSASEDASDQSTKPDPQNIDLSFSYRPHQIKKYLDRFVIKQEEAKKALSIAVCDHYNFVRSFHENPEGRLENYSKQNVVLLGPTGVGKTYLIKQIAKLIGVPFVKADATRFSETGYVGGNVDDLVRDLVAQADGDIRLAEYGIIYLDEADKLAAAQGITGRDVSGRGVQLGLLKLMEETEVDAKSAHDVASQLQSLMEFQQKGKVSKDKINTRHILFIVSGAFNGLDEIIEKRLNKKSIGLHQSQEDADADPTQFFSEVSSQDFVNYGFEPEFVGRLPVRVACQHLNKDDLYQILVNSEGSILKQYVKSFEPYGIKLKMEDDALKAIAEISEKEKTGARALNTVCEKVLREFKYELPSFDIDTLTIDRAAVENPEKTLKKILENAQPRSVSQSLAEIQQFVADFNDRQNLQIRLNKEVLTYLANLADERRTSGSKLMKDVLEGYEYGLNLIYKNTGKKEFELTASDVQNPKSSLEKRVFESYQTTTKPQESSGQTNES